MYTNRNLIEDNHYQIIDQCKERKIAHVKVYSIHLIKYIRFMMEMVEGVRNSNDDKIMKLFDRAKN